MHDERRQTEHTSFNEPLFRSFLSRKDSSSLFLLVLGLLWNISFVWSCIGVMILE